MTDICERLRQCAGGLINGAPEDGCVEVAMLAEAADEIERLRAKIEAISQVAGKASIDGGPTFAQIKGRDSDVLGKFMGETNGE